MTDAILITNIKYLLIKTHSVLTVMITYTYHYSVYCIYCLMKVYYAQHRIVCIHHVCTLSTLTASEAATWSMTFRWLIDFPCDRSHMRPYTVLHLATVASRPCKATALLLHVPFYWFTFHSHIHTYFMQVHISSFILSLLDHTGWIYSVWSIFSYLDKAHWILLYSYDDNKCICIQHQTWHL